MRGQILPPSEMKSLYGSTTSSAVMPLSYVGVFTAFPPAVSYRAPTDPLIQDRAPRPVKLHYHSGCLFSPLCDGRSLPMHVECGFVPVDFVREKFRIVVLGEQDFELQGVGLIFQATRFVRCQQR